MNAAEPAQSPLIVRVFAAPAGPNACGNTWEAATRNMEERVRRCYGERVRFEFVPLFSGEFFGHPVVLQALKDGRAVPPIVTVEEEIIQSGGKLSERLIRQVLEEHGLIDTGSEGGKS